MRFRFGQKELSIIFTTLLFMFLSVSYPTVDYSGKNLTDNTYDLWEKFFFKFSNNVHLFEISTFTLILVLFNYLIKSKRKYFLLLVVIAPLAGALLLNQSNWSLAIIFFICFVINEKKIFLICAAAAHPGILIYILIFYFQLHKKI